MLIEFEIYKKEKQIDQISYVIFNNRYRLIKETLENT